MTLQIKTIPERVKEGLTSGTMTMREAQETMCKAGFFSYIPSESQVYNYLNMFNR